MNSEIKNIPKNILSLALGALATANYHAIYLDMANGTWAEQSVLQAAHAAELLIKAKISEKNPLLIFSDLPQDLMKNSKNVNIQNLVENARTYKYQDLPSLLWTITGTKLSNVETYKAFGRIRNAIQHFHPPEAMDFRKETLKFVFEVIDPLLKECWGLHAIDYNEDYETHQYFLEALINQGIEFNVSKDAAEEYSKFSFAWPEGNDNYKKIMTTRLEEALINA